MSNAHFGADRFLEDANFRQWVRFPTPESHAYWDEFLRQNPDAAAAITEARDVLRLMDARTEANFPMDEQVQAMLTGIHERLAETPVRSLWSSGWRWAAAAGVVLALGTGWWWQTHQAPANTAYQQLTAGATTPLVEKVNTGSRPLPVVLPDGSTVHLQPNSRLSYAASFALQPKRDVYLTGEAFFEVARNPQRPFFVYANELVTKVLGTSFWVKAFEKDPQVTVSVRTGKVAVFTRTDPNATRQKATRELSGLVLTPNQQLVFARSEVRMQKALVPHPELVNQPANALAFEYRDVPVTRVFTDLKKAYGIDIVYDEVAMAHCLLTASLTDEPLYTKLDLICKGIEAQYWVQDGHIIIAGRGCR